MCSLCNRFNLFSLVSRIKPQVHSIRHIGSVYNGHPQHWRGRELSNRLVGQSVTVGTSNLFSMANMSAKRRLLSSSTSSSLHDGTARVKRVSIEGNIGKITAHSNCQNMLKTHVND